MPPADIMPDPPSLPPVLEDGAVVKYGYADDDDSDKFTMQDLNERINVLEDQLVLLTKSSWGYRFARAVQAFENKPISFGRLKHKMPTDRDGKALELRVLSCQKPHMRSFHFAWLTFFLAFMGWFSIPPMMPAIKTSLNLTKTEIYDSNIASVSATILTRVVVGPLLDMFGPRKVQSALLLLGAVPLVGCWGIKNGSQLIVVRLCLGVIGGAFVPCQFWTTQMFAPQIVGSANAMAGGWGNLGGGVTYILMPLFFDMMQAFGLSADKAWRAALCVPAAFFVIVTIPVLLYGEDSPSGKHISSAARGKGKGGGFCKGICTVITNPTVLIMMIHYACCFGVELAVNNMIGLYFFEHFKQPGCDPAVSGEDECRRFTQTQASMIASLFGLMNLWARATGGFISDFTAHQHGIVGRVYCHFAYMVAEAFFLYMFSLQTEVGTAVFCLVRLVDHSLACAQQPTHRTSTIVSVCDDNSVQILFSACVQGSEGTTYGIVPSIYPPATGWKQRGLGV
jgi:NNP family nitrate/nitrite transporter-like MFS transporter